MTRRIALAVVTLGMASMVHDAAAQSPRWFDADTVARGEPLYRQHCATCHGQRGEGAPRWRERDGDGRFPAPPLDGSGHAWHHPIRILLHVIERGSPGGQGNMPAWKGVLDREQMISIIAWFQSLWPEQAYAAWTDIEKRSRK